MRPLVLALCLAILPSVSPAVTPLDDVAPPIHDRDWQLLAIDGILIDPKASASLRIAADGTVSGKAPCNSYGLKLGAALPEFRPGPIRATRMACDRLAEEQAYFDALSIMETAALQGFETLIMTGPEGRSLEFVAAGAASTVCQTCGD